MGLCVAGVCVQLSILCLRYFNTLCEEKEKLYKHKSTIIKRPDLKKKQKRCGDEAYLC